jgi:hypothetical protein
MIDSHSLDNRDADRPWMTPLLNRIAAVAGEKAAVTLGHEKACRLIYIPNRVDEGHWLAELIGLSPARALAEHFGSQKLLIRKRDFRCALTAAAPLDRIVSVRYPALSGR